MGFNFNLRSIEDTCDLTNLRDFLLRQSLGYPGYDAWVEKAATELSRGDKLVILAFSDRKLVGNLIYQPHRDLPRVMEIKNLRVDPDLRTRLFGQFMLRQAEITARQNFQAVMCDMRGGQVEAEHLFVQNGYVLLAEAPLYDSQVPDRIYVKKFEHAPTGILVPIDTFVKRRVLN